VFLCAGEKDVDNVRAIGLSATTKAAGEKNWKEADPAPLYGRRVTILVDKDKTGREYSREVAKDLKGKAASVNLVELPGDTVKDVSDWIDARRRCGAPDALINEELAKIAETTPEWDDAPPRRRLPQPTTAVSELEKEFIAERDGTKKIITTPWPAIDHLCNPLKEGTTLIVGGPPGYGKSMLLLQLAVHLQAQCDWALMPLEGKRIDWERRALAHISHSWDVLDEKPEHAEERLSLLGQYRSDIDSILSNVNENPTLAYQNDKGEIEVPDLPFHLALEWAAEALKTKRVAMIDPLAKIDFPGHRQWQAEKEFVRKLVGIANHSKGTIILVVHTSKRSKGAGIATGEDLQGCAEILRLPECAIILHKHELIESQVSVNGMIGNALHDRMVSIEKTRNGPGQGLKLAFTLNHASYQEHGIIMPKKRRRTYDGSGQQD
jgi:hypothetical protein